MVRKLRKEFENLAFKNGEALEDFSLQVSSIISELQSLGGNIDELKAVQKFLCVVPGQYAQMACSIETLLDLNDMTIEEQTGRLAASEGRGAPEADTGGRLLLPGGVASTPETRHQQWRRREWLLWWTTARKRARPQPWQEQQRKGEGDRRY